MQQLIIIVGNGGAGKKTNGEILFSRLPRASWTHMRWMTALNIWEPTPRFQELLLRNAACVIGNYFNEGVDQAILSGGVFSQDDLDRLVQLLDRPLDIRYFWLEVSDELRRQRLIGRARDSGDSPEVVAQLIANYSFPKPSLAIKHGRFFALDAGRTPNEIVDEMLRGLKKDGKSHNDNAQRCGHSE